MQIEQKIVNDILVVTPLEKRIDASSAPDFKEKLINWILQDQKRILLDLSLVDFIDSSGLGAIVSCLKAIGNNGDLVICSIRDTVMSLFQLTRMNRVFQIFPSQDEAVRALTK